MKTTLISILMFSKVCCLNISAGTNEDRKYKFNFSADEINTIVDGLYELPYKRSEEPINTIRVQYYLQTHDTTTIHK